MSGESYHLPACLRVLQEADELPSYVFNAVGREPNAIDYHRRWKRKGSSPGEGPP